MNVKALIPSAPAVVKEAIVVLAGALIAALVVRNLPDNAKIYFTWPGHPGA